MANTRESYLPLNWERLEASSDLMRLKSVLNALDDEELIKALEKERKGRRDEYPVKVCWNCLLAGILLGHPSVAALLRELRRNPSLRRAVGMNPWKAEKSVPTKDGMSRFVQKLLKPKYAKMVERLAHQLVEKLREQLPGLDKHLAVDSTAIHTWARGRGNPQKSADPEAGWGMKSRHYKDKHIAPDAEVGRLHMLRHPYPTTCSYTACPEWQSWRSWQGIFY